MTTESFEPTAPELGQIENSEFNYIKAISIYKEKIDSKNGDLANALQGYALILEKKKMIEGAILIWKEIRDIYTECQFSSGINLADNKLKRLKKL